jgi:hypothetical protein
MRIIPCFQAIILLLFCTAIAPVFAQVRIMGGQGGSVQIIGAQPRVVNEPLSTKLTSALKLPRVKYNGGGDWYNDASCEVNLLRFFQEKTGIETVPAFEAVDLASDNIFLYPVIFLTGHGTVNFSDREVKNLRAYLENGGFLYIDDDYGMDASIRKEMQKVFPEQKFAELPFSHGLYSAFYKFSNGVPKTHEHDNKPPQGFGLFHKGRLCVYYTYESNPSDGWADKDVHNDPPEKREEALKFGVNILVWALTH